MRALVAQPQYRRAFVGQHRLAQRRVLAVGSQRRIVLHIAVVGLQDPEMLLVRLPHALDHLGVRALLGGEFGSASSACDVAVVSARWRSSATEPSASTTRPKRWTPLLLAAVPTSAWRFWSTNPFYWGTGFQYSAVLMPITFVAFLDALPTTGTRRPARIVTQPCA
jgi:hypothetical protein